MKLSVQDLVARANRQITTLSLDDAAAVLNNPTYQFVDIRDVRELEREGKIPGAFHAPRGMLEFWVDPQSPYFKDVFNTDLPSTETKTYVFYCQSSWRSALATQAVQEMGLAPVAHVDGGFYAWVKAGLPVTEHDRKRKPTATATQHDRTQHDTQNK